MVAISLGCLTGCSLSDPVVVYEPPITLEDLVPGLSAPDNNYKLLADGTTSGRFACALAVAKFVPHENDHGLELSFEATRPNEQAYWTQQMRGVSDVREVAFLSPLTLRPDPPTIPNLCAAAEALDAALLLVYAPNGLGANSAQVVGAIYDVRSCEVIATLHASAQFFNEEGLEVSPNTRKTDQRDIDARFQAQRAFEGQALACMRELIQIDHMPPTTQPHRWRKPLVERWWIPKRLRHD
jgi:hypothetical protein